MTSTRLPKTITAGALLATPIPPVKWIIPGLLPAGLAIFAGPSKAGKSWLTLWLCLQISQGKSVWGRETEPRTVLYFSLEDTLGRLQERLYQLVDAEEDPERLILQTESHGIGQGLEEQIVSFIHAYPDISLIVIDTLQKVRKSDQNGSMYANDYKDIGALKELADKYGICILLVHHLRKQSSSDPYDQISGSTGIMGVADTTWLMHRQRLLFCGFFLIQRPDAVFFADMQHFLVHITSNYTNCRGFTHALTMHKPCRICHTHNAG